MHQQGETLGGLSGLSKVFSKSLNLKEFNYKDHKEGTKGTKNLSYKTLSKPLWLTKTKTMFSKTKILPISLLIILLISIIALFQVEPITQDLAYHNFSDQLRFWSIENAWNVLSNLPFVIVGIFGFLWSLTLKKDKFQFIFLSIAIALVGFGSAYYHINPNNATLVWDRLPMTLAFTTIFSLVISQFINEKIGYILWTILVFVGIGSIWYWNKFDDLRIYALVQFYPLIAILLCLLFSKINTHLKLSYWLLLSFYVMAKICEHFDMEIHEFLVVISGHSLKHVFAAVGLWFWFKLQHQLYLNS